VFFILKPSKKIFIVKSLKEGADIVGVHYSTLSRVLDVEDTGFVAEINGHLVRRVNVFGGLQSRGIIS
jgi:hypothetical protein